MPYNGMCAGVAVLFSSARFTLLDILTREVNVGDYTYTNKLDQATYTTLQMSLHMDVVMYTTIPQGDTVRDTAYFCTYNNHAYLVAPR